MAKVDNNGESIRPDSLVSSMSQLLDAIAGIPKESASSQDIAAAITLIADAEKGLRKLKVAWIAALVVAAKQRNLV